MTHLALCLTLTERPCQSDCHLLYVSLCCHDEHKRMGQTSCVLRNVSLVTLFLSVTFYHEMAQFPAANHVTAEVVQLILCYNNFQNCEISNSSHSSMGRHNED